MSEYWPDMAELTALIHVGMPKTGTTSIQEVFFQNPVPGIRYAPYPNANHSTLCSICFEKRPEMNRPNKLLALTRDAAIARRRKTLRRLAQQMDTLAQIPNVHSVMFSGERFSNAIKANVDSHKRMRRYLGRWCDTFRIFGYARPMQSLLPSDFQQRIQSGRAAKLDLEHYYPNYRLKFEKFDQVYGREYVSLRSFTRANLIGGDAVKDFAAQIRAELPENLNLQVNASLSLEGTAILFTMVKAGRVRDIDQVTAAQNIHLVNALKGIPGQKLAFCPQELLRIAEMHEKDLRWIEDRIGAPMYEDRPPKGVVIRNEQEFFEIAAETLKSGLHQLEVNDPEAPDAETLTRWLRHDLDKLSVARSV